MRHPKQIIFLGAGASASDGAPIQSRLFEEYFSINRSVNSDIISFFKDFYGIDPSTQPKITYPSFEELLGILEISLARGESFLGYPITPENPHIQKRREQLIFLIAKILNEKLLHSRRENHDLLINRLNNEGTLKQTTFISLNYDILLDNSLTNIHEYFDLDYGIDFTNFGKKRDWHKPRKNRSIKLLKLHGSLNWLYCTTCTSVTITPKEKSVSSIAESPIKCKTCGTETTPVIIPPTFFKVMSNFHLQKIWRIAETKLAECDQLIFCGYSFPDADVHIKYLMKRMEVNSRKAPKVYIFNDHAVKTDNDRKTESQRFKTFFKGKDHVFYLKSSFQDFCNRGIPNDDSLSSLIYQPTP